MLSSVQTRNRNPHGEYFIPGIAQAYAYRKDDIYMQRQNLHGKTTNVKLYINMEMGARDLYNEKAHMALAINDKAFYGILNILLN